MLGAAMPPAVIKGASCLPIYHICRLWRPLFEVTVPIMNLPDPFFTNGDPAVSGHQDQRPKGNQGSVLVRICL